MTGEVYPQIHEEEKNEKKMLDDRYCGSDSRFYVRITNLL